MEIQLPTTGCNISQSAGYIDNYNNTTRTRYLISENKLTMVYRTTYNSLPTGYTCLSTGDIIYKPELAIYFPILAGGMIVLALVVLFKITIDRILK